MKQHITQEQATSIAAKFAEDWLYETNICNAAIQHYIDQRAKELPVLPEPLVERISGHRDPFVFYDADQLQAYGQQCAAHAREVALAGNNDAWKLMCEKMVAQALEAQLAEIAATEPVAWINLAASTKMFRFLEPTEECGTVVKDWKPLFTRPMPADVTELVEALEAAQRWHNGDKWRDTDKHEEWQTQADSLTAALSKYKGVK